MRLRLIHLDGSLRGQDAAWPAASLPANVIEAEDVGPALRLWAARGQLAAFGARLAAAPAGSGSGPLVTFLGSGDYHHLTPVLLAALPGRFTVIHLDNHPDWVRLPPAGHCGSWVNRALELPQVARIITVGPCSDDLVWPQLKGANLAALATGRLELYPYAHAPSRVLGQVGAGCGYQQQGHHLVWRAVSSEDWDAFWEELLARLPTREVYLTIDKDVLATAAAVTNWDQGQLPLAKLLRAVALIAARTTLVGVDVVGEYAPPRFHGLLKRFAARLDQPQTPPPAPAALQRNLAANAALCAQLWSAA